MVGSRYGFLRKKGRPPWGLEVGSGFLENPTKFIVGGQILRDRSSPDDFTDHVVGGENRAMILRGRCV